MPGLRERGRKLTENVLYCVECGNAVLASMHFCNACGADQPIEDSEDGNPTPVATTRNESVGASAFPASDPTNPAPTVSLRSGPRKRQRSRRGAAESLSDGAWPLVAQRYRYVRRK